MPSQPPSAPRVRLALPKELKHFLNPFLEKAYAAHNPAYLVGRCVRHILDPFGGVEDLKAKKIRVLHAQSFLDDPTRIFRAARFAGRFGYDLEWRTREWLTEAVSQQLPARLSGARLREELIPLLMEKD